MVQRGLDDGHSLMGSCKLGALSGTMVVSTVGLVRAFTSVYHLGDGWRIEVVVNIGACTQGASFRYYLGVGNAGCWGTRPCLFF
jgi:hypothetical protein